MKHDLKAHTWEVLDIATSHVPQSTAVALDEAIIHQRGDLWTNLSFTNWGEYGWIFYTGDDPSCDSHPELTRVLQFAHEQGFNWLRLDRDADALPTEMLPVFDW